MRNEPTMPTTEQDQAREASVRFASVDSTRANRAEAGEGGTDPVSAPISETTAERNDTVSPEMVARLHAERDAAGVNLPGPSASSFEVLPPEAQS